MVKSLEFFFKSHNKCFKYLSIFFIFRFGQILFNLAHMSTVHHEKGVVPAFFKVSIEHLFDDLESGKRNYCGFGKKCGKKVLKCGSKNLHKPCVF